MEKWLTQTVAVALARRVVPYVVALALGALAGAQLIPAEWVPAGVPAPATLCGSSLSSPVLAARPVSP